MDARKEKSSFCSSNNIHRLPPEFLRKGRFDEIFFVDLPFEDERKEIFKIHLSRRKRKPTNFDLDLLVKESDGYSGAEIEEAIISALYRVFKLGQELTTEDILQVIKETRPLSETMKEQIQDMRSWAKNRARYASFKGRTETGEIFDRWTMIGGLAK
jgi:SpoVK/Ycf46/Vps4 family AAA+-type ATPase